MLAELILIAVLLAFIGFGVYVLYVDVMRWQAKEGGPVPSLGIAPVAKSLPSAAPSAPLTRVRSIHSSSGKHHDFRPATLEGTIGEHQVKDLVAHMRDPLKGLPLKTRYYNLKKRNHAFTGTEAVDWFVATLHLKSREEAVSYGEKLLLRGIIHNVSRLYPFADRRELLYRFSKRTFNLDFVLRISSHYILMIIIDSTLNHHHLS